MQSPKTFLSLILVVLLLVGCSENPVVKRDFILMDTFVSIEVKDPLNKTVKNEAIDKSALAMKQSAERFNYYDKKSELSEINKLKAGEEMLLSDDMFKVLGASRELYEKTDGAFDIAAGTSPGHGLEAWELDEHKKAIKLKSSNAGIDLGGIAKGFTVDAGINILKEYKIKDGIINAGGDIYCTGRARIGIRDPKNRNKIIAIFEIDNKGVATSGTYERPGHIKDPRTGKPVQKGLESVTVVAKNCATADGLATALFILDTERALSVIEGIVGVECAIIDEKGILHVSSGMPQITLTKDGL